MEYPYHKSFSFLKDVSDKVVKDFYQYSILKKVKKDQIIYLEGDRCDYFNLVLSGILRIYKSGEGGREITLYKVFPGESCLLTAFSILSHTTFPAIAVADVDTRMVLIPAEAFRDWVTRYDVWRDYLFRLLSGRLNEIISKIEALAFQRVDERIAEFLASYIQRRQRSIKITHSDIARELGTAREVVSRILKNFERDNLVELSRGHITILNEEALRHMRFIRAN